MQHGDLAAQPGLFLAEGNDDVGGPGGVRQATDDVKYFHCSTAMWLTEYVGLRTASAAEKMILTINALLRSLNQAPVDTGAPVLHAQFVPVSSLKNAVDTVMYE